MPKRILYAQPSGVVAVIIPSTDCGLTVEQIAEKDVPTGEPYWIVDASEVPADRSARELWTIDPAEAGSPDGIGG